MGGASPNHSMVAAALDEDDVAVDAVVERRDLDGTSARQRDSWCFTMRATPLQNWQPRTPSLPIKRPAISIDTGTLLLELLLDRVVAGLAQRLQRAEHELVPIAAMRLDLIDDNGAGELPRSAQNLQSGCSSSCSRRRRAQYAPV